MICNLSSVGKSSSVVVEILMAISSLFVDLIESKMGQIRKKLCSGANFVQYKTSHSLPHSKLGFPISLPLAAHFGHFLPLRG